MQQFLRVGVIASTHGVRGEVKVYPTTDDLERFKSLKQVILVTQRKEEIPLTVAGVKFFKQFAILKFKGIDNIDDIQKYKGCDLLVSRENAQPLAENEYYIGDLIGMKLVDDDRDIMLITNEGILIRMGVSDISVIGRNTSGVKLMSIDPDSDTKVATIAKVRESSTNQDEEIVEENEASEE